MRTSEVAAQAHVNAQTLRYYERRGLPSQPQRTRSGYRAYHAEVTVMRIELLTSPGCPNAETTRKILADCLSSLGIDEPITDRVGHYPSPTVLVNGVDVMRPDAVAPTGDACRLDLPTPQHLLDALRPGRSNSTDSQRSN